MNTKFEETNALLRAVLKLQKDWGRYECSFAGWGFCLCYCYLARTYSVWLELCQSNVLSIYLLCWWPETMWWNKCAGTMCGNLQPETYMYACLWMITMCGWNKCVWFMTCDVNHVDDGFSAFCGWWIGWYMCIMLLWDVMKDLCRHWICMPRSSWMKTTCDTIQSSQNASNYHPKQDEI
jgi:hypothetical protein